VKQRQRWYTKQFINNYENAIEWNLFDSYRDWRPENSSWTRLQTSKTDATAHFLAAPASPAVSIYSTHMQHYTNYTSIHMTLTSTTTNTTPTTTRTTTTTITTNCYFCLMFNQPRIFMPRLPEANLWYLWSMLFTCLMPSKQCHGSIWSESSLRYHIILPMLSPCNISVISQLWWAKRHATSRNHHEYERRGYEYQWVIINVRKETWMHMHEPGGNSQISLAGCRKSWSSLAKMSSSTVTARHPVHLRYTAHECCWTARVTSQHSTLVITLL